MKKCKVLPLPSNHCFSSPSVVQCPCWRSCVHCSSWGSVPKCTNPLTFMLAVTSDHFHHLYVNVNYQYAWRLWVQQPAAPRSARPSYWCTHPGMNLHEISLTFCQALRVYVGLKLGKKPWWWGQERHVACPCACVCVCHRFALILFFTTRLWLYVGFDDCLPVDYTHELTPGMQLTVDRNTLERSVWKEQNEMFL